MTKSKNPLESGIDLDFGLLEIILSSVKKVTFPKNEKIITSNSTYIQNQNPPNFSYLVSDDYAVPSFKDLNVTSSSTKQNVKDEDPDIEKPDLHNNNLFMRTQSAPPTLQEQNEYSQAHPHYFPIKHDSSSPLNFTPYDYPDNQLSHLTNSSTFDEYVSSTLYYPNTFPYGYNNLSQQLPPATYSFQQKRNKNILPIFDDNGKQVNFNKYESPTNIVISDFNIQKKDISSSSPVGESNPSVKQLSTSISPVSSTHSTSPTSPHHRPQPLPPSISILHTASNRFIAPPITSPISDQPSPSPPVTVSFNIEDQNLTPSLPLQPVSPLVSPPASVHSLSPLSSRSFISLTSNESNFKTFKGSQNLEHRTKPDTVSRHVYTRDSLLEIHTRCKLTNIDNYLTSTHLIYIVADDIKTNRNYIRECFKNTNFTTEIPGKPKVPAGRGMNLPHKQSAASQRNIPRDRQALLTHNTKTRHNDYGYTNPIKFTLPSSENRWKPGIQNQTALGNLGSKVKSILNRLTVDKLDVLSQELISMVQSVSIDQMSALIDMIFDKALFEPNFSSLYADLCNILSKNIKIYPPEYIIKKNGEKKEKNFLNVLITKLEKEFKLSYNPNEINEQDKDRLEEQLYKLKRRALGNIKFIAELYNNHSLKEKIIYKSLDGLVGRNIYDPQHGSNEAELEALCKFLSNVGLNLIKNQKRDNRLEKFVNSLKEHLKNPNLSARMSCFIKDVVDLEKNNWVALREEIVPKTLEDINKDVEEEKKKLIAERYKRPIGLHKYHQIPKEKEKPKHDVSYANKQYSFYTSMNNNENTEKRILQKGQKPSDLLSDYNLSSLNLSPSSRGSFSQLSGPSSPLNSSVTEFNSEQEKLVEGIINEYLLNKNISDVKESLFNIHHSPKPNILSYILSIAFEKKPSQQDLICDMIILLFHSNIFSRSDLFQGLINIFKLFNDLIIDSPNITQYLSMFLSHFLGQKILTIKIFEHQSFFDTEHSTILLGKTLEQLTKRIDKKDFQHLLSDLKIDKYLQKNESLSSFLSEYNLDDYDIWSQQSINLYHLWSIEPKRVDLLSKIPQYVIFYRPLCFGLDWLFKLLITYYDLHNYNPSYYPKNSGKHQFHILLIKLNKLDLNQSIGQSIKYFFQKYNYPDLKNQCNLNTDNIQNLVFLIKKLAIFLIIDQTIDYPPFNFIAPSIEYEKYHKSEEDLFHNLFDLINEHHLERLFIGGQIPFISLSKHRLGYVVDNISDDCHFENLCGFTHPEIEKIIGEISKHPLFPNYTENEYKDFFQIFGGYHFTSFYDDTTPSLYQSKGIENFCSFINTPKSLSFLSNIYSFFALDDVSRYLLDHMAKIYQDQHILHEIAIETADATSLSSPFPLSTNDDDSFNSLLYYCGLLSHHPLVENHFIFPNALIELHFLKNLDGNFFPFPLLVDYLNNGLFCEGFSLIISTLRSFKNYQWYEKSHSLLLHYIISLLRVSFHSIHIVPLFPDSSHSVVSILSTDRRHLYFVSIWFLDMKNIDKDFMNLQTTQLTSSPLSDFPFHSLQNLINDIIPPLQTMNHIETKMEKENIHHLLLLSLNFERLLAISDKSPIVDLLLHDLNQPS